MTTESPPTEFPLVYDGYYPGTVTTAIFAASAVIITTAVTPNTFLPRKGGLGTLPFSVRTGGLGTLLLSLISEPTLAYPVSPGSTTSTIPPGVARWTSYSLIAAVLAAVVFSVVTSAGKPKRMTLRRWGSLSDTQRQDITRRASQRPAAQRSQRSSHAASSTGQHDDTLALWRTLIGALAEKHKAVPPAASSGQPSAPEPMGVGLSGISLVLSSKSTTGYMGVVRKHNHGKLSSSFQARHNHKVIATCGSAREAAEAYALHLQSLGLNRPPRTPSAPPPPSAPPSPPQQPTRLAVHDFGLLRVYIRLMAVATCFARAYGADGVDDLPGDPVGYRTRARLAAGAAAIAAGAYLGVRGRSDLDRAAATPTPPAPSSPSSTDVPSTTSSDVEGVAQVTLQHSLLRHAWAVWLRAVDEHHRYHTHPSRHLLHSSLSRAMGLWHSKVLQAVEAERFAQFISARCCFLWHSRMVRLMAGMSDIPLRDLVELPPELQNAWVASCTFPEFLFPASCRATRERVLALRLRTRDALCRVVECATDQDELDGIPSFTLSLVYPSSVGHRGRFPVLNTGRLARRESVMVLHRRNGLLPGSARPKRPSRASSHC